MDLPAGGIFPGPPAVAWYGWRASAEVKALGAAVAAQLRCTDAATALACLRDLPVQDLFAHAQPFQPYGFGNQVLPEVPARALRDGRFHQVPVLSGATRDEQRLFVGLFRVLAGQPVTAARYPELLAEAFGEHADQVQATYPLPRPAVPGGQHSRRAAPVRPDDPLLGQLRPHRRPQRRRPAAMAPLRRCPARAARPVAGAWARWHRTGRLRRRAPARLLVHHALKDFTSIGARLSGARGIAFHQDFD
jgi:Carboxylesterase family